jgi:hypothetical protein
MGEFKRSTLLLRLVPQKFELDFKHRTHFTLVNPYSVFTEPSTATFCHDVVDVFRAAERVSGFHTMVSFEILHD